MICSFTAYGVVKGIYTCGDVVVVTMIWSVNIVMFNINNLKQKSIEKEVV